MLRKISLLFSIFIFIGINYCFGGCSYDGTANINSDLIEGCISNKNLVQGKMNVVGGGFKTKIESWTNTITGILGLFAVFSIVYGSLMLVISIGEEDKIKKGKDIIKWGLIGFLGIISAGALIKVVIGILVTS